MEMAEGLATMYDNLHAAVEKMDNVEPTWLPIPLNPAEQVSPMPLAKAPPFSTSWSLQRALLARASVRALEKSGRSFDAAHFNTTAPAFFLRPFRRRVPCVDALDATPIILKRYGYYNPRADGNILVRRLRDRLAQNVFKDAVHLLPWSRFVKESLVTDYGIAEDKISIVPPGIDLKIWSGRPRNSRCDATSPGNLKVLFVGGNFARKGGDLLLKVARRDEFRQCDFHIVTTGLSNRVNGNTFVHQNIRPNSEQLISLYGQADIFVLPTRADVFSLATLEAMAMGLPVITTNVGGIGEIVTDGESGFIIPVDDESALLERMRLLIGNPELRARLGEKGRQLVESRFNLETMARTIVDFLVKAAA
jgi:glycosyltransferase involved in cell wall biosynthesis